MKVDAVTAIKRMRTEEDPDLKLEQGVEDPVSYFSAVGSGVKTIRSLQTSGTKTESATQGVKGLEESCLEISESRHRSVSSSGYNSDNESPQTSSLKLSGSAEESDASLTTSEPPEVSRSINILQRISEERYSNEPSSNGTQDRLSSASKRFSELEAMKKEVDTLKNTLDKARAAATKLEEEHLKKNMSQSRHYYINMWINDFTEHRKKNANYINRYNAVIEEYNDVINNIKDTCGEIDIKDLDRLDKLLKILTLKA